MRSNKDLLKKAGKIHFVGVGGIGISAIARMLLTRGKKVTGSDLSENPITRDLQSHGAQVFIEQDIKNIPRDTELIIYSAAVADFDKNFFVELMKLPIPSISYPEALGIISDEKKTIAVSGCHGKTTTTAMIGKILKDAGLDPTIIVGSILLEEGTNFIAGKGTYLVVEADEYKRAFLNLSPKILVINNIDEDHLDYFKNLADIQNAFAELAGKVPKNGFIITNIEDQNIEPVLEMARAPVLDYMSVKPFDVKLALPGEHNRHNAQAAYLAATSIGVSPKQALLSLRNFKGTWRRFEYEGEMKSGATIFSDYAHNPAKVKSAIAGAREAFPDRKITVVFEPHLYSRTKHHLSTFAKALSTADKIILLPIFAARETFDSTVSSQVLLEGIKKININARLFNTYAEITKYLLRFANKGEVIILMGAGDVYKLSEGLVVAK